jgi:hypothetical protein
MLLKAEKSHVPDVARDPVTDVDAPSPESSPDKASPK